MVASLDLCHSFDSLAELGVASRCEAAVIMDADGEDCPASVGCLLELQSDAVDVVVAERRKRSEPWYFRMSYFLPDIFYLLTGENIRFGNFCALSSCALKRSASQRLALRRALWVHFS